MKRSIASIAALLGSVALGAAGQTPAAPAGPEKVAVIAFQDAVTQTNEFQRNFADLQKKYEPKRQQLKTLSDQVDELKKQLQTQAATLNDADRESRARVIDDKEKELQRNLQDDQNDFKQDMQDTFNGVAQKVGQLLISYAKGHGYTVVLDGETQTQQPLVLYANQTADITKAIIDAYNVKSGIPAPPQAAPAAPKPASTRPSAPAPH